MLAQATGGRAIETNLALLEANAGLAGELAVELARTCDAKLTALYVIDPYPYLGVGESNPLGFQAYMSSAYDHAAQAQAKVAALCAKDGKPITETQDNRSI